MDQDILRALGKFEVIAPPMIITDKTPGFFDVMEESQEETETEKKLDATILQRLIADYGWNGEDPRTAMTPLKREGAESDIFPFHPAHGLYAMAWTYFDPAKPDAPFNWDNTLALILKEHEIDGKKKLMPHRICASAADIVIPFRFGCCSKSGCSLAIVIDTAEGTGLMQVDSPVTKDAAEEFFLLHLAGGLTTDMSVLRHVVAHALGQDHACDHNAAAKPLAPVQSWERNPLKLNW